MGISLNKVCSAAFLEDVQRLIQTKQVGKQKKKVADNICKKYSISQEALYYRIRKYYGKSVRQLQQEYFEPSKEDLWEAVKASNSSEEVWSRFDISHNRRVGLFRKHFGECTFQKVKLLEIAEMHFPAISPYYHPDCVDKLSVLAACRLGDCGFVKRSGKWSIRCEQSLKQEDWLRMKVNLLNKYFSWMLTDIKIRDRSFGKTCFWYGGTFSTKLHNNFLDIPKKKLVGYINHFGVWWLFMDDGSNTRTGKQRKISFAVENEEVGTELQMLLAGYGYKFIKHNKNSIGVSDQYQVLKFLKEFIYPYRMLTPECMHYKLASE